MGGAKKIVGYILFEKKIIIFSIEFFSTQFGENILFCKQSYFANKVTKYIYMALSTTQNKSSNQIEIKHYLVWMTHTTI